MRIIDSADITEAVVRRMGETETSHVYNGLDCCVTFEIMENLEAELRDEPQCVRDTYADSLAKLGPFTEMSLRGLRVDSIRKSDALRAFQQDLDRLQSIWDQYCEAAFDNTLNWASPKQMQTLFYDYLQINPIKGRNSKGAYVPTTNEDALLKLADTFYGGPFARLVLAMRSIQKSMGFLKSQVDPDGRFRCQLNVCGTNTGRASSEMSNFETGSNLQNVDTRLRDAFVADPGYILVNVDLEQADARNVGAILWTIFRDVYGDADAGRYLDFCESGDLHTGVTSMIWPELPWPQTDRLSDPKLWKKVAAALYVKDKSYRDVAKGAGHGSNYMGQPRTISKQTGVPVEPVAAFQAKYFQQFPLIPAWHKWTIEQIKTLGFLTTLYGRRRFFFGRGDDASVHRAAVAYSPQSMTGHEMDMGIINLFRRKPEAQLLIQVHDSILFQVPIADHERHVEESLRHLEFRFDLAGGREFTVPLEAKTGYNWGYYNETRNPFGLRDWRGHDEREQPKSGLASLF